MIIRRVRRLEVSRFAASAGDRSVEHVVLVDRVGDEENGTVDFRRINAAGMEAARRSVVNRGIVGSDVEAAVPPNMPALSQVVAEDKRVPPFAGVRNAQYAGGEFFTRLFENQERVARAVDDARKRNPAVRPEA